MNPWPWQPTLETPRLKLRPLTEADFEPLFRAASDPLIWAIHPDRERYTRPRFEVYFRGGMESRGALAILDAGTGEVIGSSRYMPFGEPPAFVEIGYTFLMRPYWGTGCNRELKAVMLAHAFAVVDSVYFVVGEENLRSRKAVSKLGAREVACPYQEDPGSKVYYLLRRSEWHA
jgi:RimJ/RimL family protein N-acetyltransferase